jgi:hypothetical protein
MSKQMRKENPFPQVEVTVPQIEYFPGSHLTRVTENDIPANAEIRNFLFIGKSQAGKSIQVSLLEHGVSYTAESRSSHSKRNNMVNQIFRAPDGQYIRIVEFPGDDTLGDEKLLQLVRATIENIGEIHGVLMFYNGSGNALTKRDFDMFETYAKLFDSELITLVISNCEQYAPDFLPKKCRQFTEYVNSGFMKFLRDIEYRILPVGVYTTEHMEQARIDPMFQDKMRKRVAHMYKPLFELITGVPIAPPHPPPPPPPPPMPTRSCSGCSEMFPMNELHMVNSYCYCEACDGLTPKETERRCAVRVARLRQIRQGKLGSPAN